MKTTSAGQLREMVRIESHGDVSDGQGGSTSAWAVVQAGLSARITTKSGSEQVLGERMRGVVMKDITLRYSSLTNGLTADMRAVDERSGEVFNILTVTHDERKKWVFLTCSVGTAQ